MKKLKISTILIAICFILTSCNIDFGNKDDETWTILMYVCGTDLESADGFASANIDEILNADIDDNINIIIQTGGTKKWTNKKINPEKTQRFLVDDGKLRLIDEKELQNMGESETLTEFIDFGLSNYKAENHGLIVWNHGAGSIDGVAFDEMFYNDSLLLVEMEQALNDCKSLNGKFDFVGFDCCLMSSIETAKVLEPFAKYMIASEEYEPGGGWNYKSWLEYLSDNSYKSGKGIGKQICIGYMEKCFITNCEDMATLAVVDLSKVSKIVDALEDVSVDFCKNIDNEYNYSVIAKGAGKTEQYGGSSEEEGYSNLIDLSNLMSNLKEEYGIKAQKVIDAIDEAVVFSVNGELRKNSKGLSIYYPLDIDSKEINEYQYIAASTSYNDYLVRSNNKIKENNNYGYDDYVLSEPFINDDGFYELDFNLDRFDFIDSIYFSLFYLGNENDSKMLYLGSDNDVIIDYETAIVEDNFSGLWPSLNGNLINLDLIEENDNYLLYTVPIILNGKETNLRISWSMGEDDEEGQYEILGTWDGVDTENGMSSRKITKLQKGDEISLVYYYYDFNTKDYIEEVGESFVLDNEPKIEYIDLNQGSYYYKFNFKDIYGEEFDTEYTEFYIDENGEIYADY